LKVTNKTTKEQTVVPGTSDVELLNVEVTSKTDLEINDYEIKFETPANPFALGICSDDTIDNEADCKTADKIWTPNFVENQVTVYID
jgi:hypothetical protein